MRAEIITSGTELLLGEVIDTNTPYLARELASIGITVHHNTTVGDNPDRLLDAIKHAETRADIIIVSGGLGPTQDDITKNILAEHLNVDLVLDEESMKKARIRYNTEKISKGNDNQARILEGSLPLPNDVGMAAGIFMEASTHTYVLLPGPPNEFEQMVSHHLLPKLAEFAGDNERLRSRNLNFYGIPEAVVAERLDDIIQTQSNPTIAVYAKFGIIDVRITASGKTDEECTMLLDLKETEILERIGDHFFSYGKTRLQDVFLEELHKKGDSIALLEVLTDGSTTDYWSRNLKRTAAFKGSNVFTEIEHASTFYNIENIDDLSRSELNEHYADEIKRHFKSDYGVAVIGWGTENLAEKQPERIAWISIALPNGKILTEKVDYSRSQNPARWMLSLKVSDYVRRILLDLPALERN